MLVLTRELDESVVLECPDGTRIVVTVNRITWHSVRLAFDAPRSVTIHRGEVQELVDAEHGTPITEAHDEQ